jgi:hypothetical protein
MDQMLQVQTVFHLTGQQPAAPLEAIGKLGLRPALLARYRDLARLRYDFPLVLTDAGPGGPVARPLSSIVNEVAHNTAPAGPSGEALRKRLLRVERDIRRAVAGGATGLLSELWKQAVARLTGVEDEQLRQVLAQAGAAIGVDGDVVDCDEQMPRKLFTHAWRVVQREKLARVRADLNGLIVRLNDILRADFVGSEAGRRPESLKAAMGTRQQGMFDFDVMARLLAVGAPGHSLPAPRRERIERALAVLRSQRFFPGALDSGAAPYEFVFDSCRGVQQAFRERLPEMAELVKAMSVAELESEGRYDERKHDAYFAPSARTPCRLTTSRCSQTTWSACAAGPRTPRRTPTSCSSCPREFPSRCSSRPTTSSRKPPPARGASPLACAASSWPASRSA